MTPITFQIISHLLESDTIQFRSECTGAHHEQEDMALFAEVAGKPAGELRYCIYNDEITVQWIHVDNKFRRQGIARAMAQHLQSEYPDQSIEWSNTTDDGTAFLDKLDRVFDPNANYATRVKARDEAKLELDRLQAEMDASDTPLSREKMDRYGDLDRFVWSMDDELRSMKPGRWKIPPASM
jgi:GNAT superfamily N-acetyltransferase